MNVLIYIKVGKEQKICEICKVNEERLREFDHFLALFYEAKTVTESPSFGVFRKYLTFIYMLASNNV